MPLQFLIWLRAALVGDLGTSISLHRSVIDVLGESGAGKSTIARAVLGMLPRTVRVR